MSDTHVEVIKSISGKWWRLRYRGKIEFTEDEPTEAQKVAFRKAVEAAPRHPTFSGNGRSLTVADMDTRQVVEQIK